jgi:predicted kinase
MATLFLICGLPCAGKTTLARVIEVERNALRLTPDEWMIRIVGDGFDEKKREAVEAVQWEIATRVLTLGVNVVIDFGLWTRAERADFRARAEAIGAKTKLIYLDISREERLRRLAARNAALPPDAFPVTEARFDFFTSVFETPTTDELVRAKP